MNRVWAVSCPFEMLVMRTTIEWWSMAQSCSLGVKD